MALTPARAPAMARALAVALTVALATGSACAPPIGEEASTAVMQPTDPTGAAAARAGIDQERRTAHARGPDGALAVVDSVVDGDTIVVRLGNNTETVRLLGIDTPEKPGGPRPAECHGQEATAALEALLPEGTDVLLTRDIDVRDLYGRVLAYIHRRADAMFINQTMIEIGAADTLSIAPNTLFADDFAAARQRARSEGQGLWGACGAADLVLRSSD